MSSYFFLRILSRFLAIELRGAVLVEAYRQTKQSVVFCFEKQDGKIFFIEAVFFMEECLIHFPSGQSKSRKALSILKETWGLSILDVEQSEQERAFAIHLENNLSIVFKWFGRQSNVLLWEEGQVKWLLRSKIKNDLLYHRSVFHKPIVWTEQEFIRKEENLHQFIPQLGKETIEAWKIYAHWDELMNTEDRWLKVNALLEYLTQPVFYVLQKNKQVRFSTLFFKEADTLVLAEEKDPIKAANLYFSLYYRYNRVEFLKEKLNHFFTTKIAALSKSIAQVKERIDSFDHTIPPNQLADVIMSYLTVFETQQQAEVLNFYTGETILVRIKEGMSAVEYANSLYKKSKNRQSEKEHLLSRLTQLQNTLHTLKEEQFKLDNIEPKELLLLKEKYVPEQRLGKSKEDVVPVFKEYEFQGYKIYVGRNAKNNDELTLHFAHKEDLWLHARDVSGSHVIVKHKADKIFPKPVIERAAQLAAFYSKRKNESLCPVIYTPRKYVRKVKGSPAGMVKVEKESVLLVVPSE